MTERRWASVATAAALFSAIFVLRATIGTLADAISFLYVIPVVLVATVCGTRAGLLAGGVAFLLSSLGALLTDAPTSVLGYVNRAIVYLFVGGLTGRFATIRKALEQELERLSRHDSLTGLFNRRRFEEELRRQLAYTRRYGGGGALLMIDLDRFKQINDELGHAAGDRALCHVAGLLSDNLRASDTVARDVDLIVARLGGDEFVALLPEVDEAGAEAAAERLARRLSEKPLAIDGRKVGLRVSIGIAIFDEHGIPGEQDLLADADRAMYLAKAGGGGGAKLAASPD